MLYNSLVLPHFDYADVVWGTACGTYIKQVYKLQKRAARIMTGASRFSRTAPLFAKLKWSPLAERIKFHRAVLTYKSLHGLAPNYLTNKLSQVGKRNQYCTRAVQSRDLEIPKPNLEVFRKSFSYLAAAQWNSIDKNIRQAHSVNHFKTLYKKKVLT